MANWPFSSSENKIFTDMMASKSQNIVNKFLQFVDIQGEKSYVINMIEKLVNNDVGKSAICAAIAYCENMEEKSKKLIDIIEPLLPKIENDSLTCAALLVGSAYKIYFVNCNVLLNITAKDMLNNIDNICNIEQIKETLIQNDVTFYYKKKLATATQGDFLSKLEIKQKLIDCIKKNLTDIKHFKLNIIIKKFGNGAYLYSNGLQFFIVLSLWNCTTIQYINCKDVCNTNIFRDVMLIYSQHQETVFFHELLHFLFFQYFYERCKISKEDDKIARCLQNALCDLFPNKVIDYNDAKQIFCAYENYDEFFVITGLFVKDDKLFYFPINENALNASMKYYLRPSHCYTQVLNTNLLPLFKNILFFYHKNNLDYTIVENCGYFRYLFEIIHNIFVKIYKMLS